MRLLPSTAVALLLLAPAASAQKPATSAPDKKPVLGAKLAACTTGAGPGARAATFTAAMPTAKGTRRMAVRFELQQQLAGGGFKGVQVPGWGWERSEAGRIGFIYTKRVQDLLAPATYRAVMRFRWYGRGGKVLKEARRTTPECVQPDPRPDLVLERFGVRSAAEPGTAVYELVVANTGLDAAAPSTVALNVGSELLPAASAGPLAAGSRELITVTGPRCEPGVNVTITLDADAAVGERDEANTYVRPCPAV